MLTAGAFRNQTFREASTRHPSTTVTHGVPTAILFVCLLTAALSGCDKKEDPESSQAPPGTITGRERLGWDQPAPDADELAQYSYVLYVDSGPVLLSDTTCGALTGELPTASCSSPLPPLRPGTHTLELGTRITRGDQVLESERSAPLVVTVVGSGTAGFVSQGAQVLGSGRRGGVTYLVEAIVRGVDSPSSLAKLPDGRLLIAERRGRIWIAESGLLADRPAVEFTDADTGDGGRVSLAVAPDFTVTHHVYVSYVARNDTGALVGRVVRLREVGGALGERAVILEGLPADAGVPRARISPDGALYVATSAVAAGDAEDLGSYAGKILRFNVSGATPADNPIPSSPVFSFGFRGRLDFDWEPASGGLWQTEIDDGGVSIGRSEPGRRGERVVYLEGIQAAAVAFHSGPALAGWGGSLLLASPDQECLFRVSGLTSSPPEHSVERLFAGAYGRIVAVLSADDGLYFATGNGDRDANGRSRDAVFRISDKPARE
jgi:glucose/arabinose dehydrogenase